LPQRVRIRGGADAASRHQQCLCGHRTWAAALAAAAELHTAAAQQRQRLPPLAAGGGAGGGSWQRQVWQASACSSQHPLHLQQQCLEGFLGHFSAGRAELAQALSWLQQGGANQGLAESHLRRHKAGNSGGPASEPCALRLMLLAVVRGWLS
jgi:hypothetical protein